MKKYMALGAVLAALGAGAAALGQTAAAGGAAAARQDTGGLSMLPVVVEHDARPGLLATYKVANRSGAPMAVTVTPRPWVQATNGKVSPNRKKHLKAQIAVSEPSFTLAVGESKEVNVSLTSAPGGSLYGALEIVGIPADAATRKGVVLGYRLVGTIRILPSSPTVSLSVGSPKASGKGAVIPVKNKGNTVDPVSVQLRLKGATGTRTPTVPSVRILPGSTFHVPTGTLPKGSYTATLKLTQRGKTAASVTKKLRIK